MNEQQYGTASRGTLWLMLEHPGPWGLHPPYDTPLPETARRYLLNVLEEFPLSRVLFIKQERRSAALRLFAAVSRESAPELYAFALSSYDQLPELDLGTLVDGQHPHAHIGKHPLFLVCTDGKHDRCCAKFGLPIYQSLRAYAGDAVWQASHVGGDRFAANVVCFPHGLFYGHIGPEDIQPLAESYRVGHIYLPNYRGRACYPFVVQAAEYFVRAETGITQADALRLERRVRLDDVTWMVEFGSSANSGIHRVTLREELSPFDNYLRCKAVQVERVRQYRLLSYLTRIVNSIGGKDGN